MRPNKCGLNELIKRSNTIKIVNGGGKKQCTLLFQNTKSYLQTDTEKYTLCMHHSVRILLGRLWKSVTKQRHRVSCLLI